MWTGYWSLCAAINRALAVSISMVSFSTGVILTTNLAACVSVCVSVQNLTNFCPHALISTPNVPKILFA